MIKAVGILVLSGGCAIAGMLVWIAVEHRTEATLPEPTGPFAVGRAVYDWAAGDATDSLAPAGARRELLVWIWYPAGSGGSGTSDYFPAPLRAALDGTGPPLLKLLTRDPSKVHGHSRDAADVSPGQPSYPVVVMRGGASAPVARYSTLAEDLASHGYFVVGFDAPYRTAVVAFPDGRVVAQLPANNPEACLRLAGPDQARCADRLLTAWTADIGFVLDELRRLNGADASGRFRGRLDLTRIGVFGHSFGGAAALQFCQQDPRCTAGIDIDGAPQGSVVQTGVGRPFMWLLSDHARHTDPESRRIMADIRSLYERLPADRRALVMIRGANHFLFSDDGALRSRILLRTLRLLNVVGIDGRRQLALTTRCVRSFFDVQLKGTPPVPLRDTSELYPEIQVLD